MSYEQVKSCYDEICKKHPTVIRKMTDSIDVHVAHLNSVSSKDAGRDLLKSNRQFKNLCGKMASQVFGILLKQHLTSAGWKLDDTDLDTASKLYRR